MNRGFGCSLPIDLSAFEHGTRTDLNLPIYQNALGYSGQLPFIILKGQFPGPSLGISAVVHGNELNGISIIHRLLQTLDPSEMKGSVVCAPVVNAPAFNYGQRRFPEDDVDLNHVFPGKRQGKPAEQYAKAFASTFLPCCDYLVDIHTASEGRSNTLYARADLQFKEARALAEIIEPAIILHGRSGDGTLRSAARRRGIPSITLEAGNPSVFQGDMIENSERGLRRILSSIGILPDDADLRAAKSSNSPIICKSSKWLRTTEGGLMHCHFKLGELIKKGQRLADIVDIFGLRVSTYKSPSDGVVIGKAESPLSVPGTRFCHLGQIGEPAANERKKQ